MIRNGAATLFALALCPVVAQAQYGCTPGAIPAAIPPEELRVEGAGPFPADFSLLPSSLRGSPPEVSGVRFSENCEAMAFTLIGDMEYVDMVLGPWGMNFNHCFNMGIECGLSPSGDYFATGGDGTDVNRGPVGFFHMDSGVLYTTGLTTLDNTGWIPGDMMLVETLRSADLDQTTGIAHFPWINYSAMAGDGFHIRDLVLLKGEEAWLVLPEDSCYNYRLTGQWSADGSLLTFHVEASPNVLPSEMGWETVNDLRDWVVSVGYDEAFPVFGFSVALDTISMTITDIDRTD